jgi:hypothetical protein
MPRGFNSAEHFDLRTRRIAVRFDITLDNEAQTVRKFYGVPWIGHRDRYHRRNRPLI